MMDVLERWQATFNHEEPDYVSSFVQVIMNKKKNEIDALYGESFADDDLSVTPFGDYTLQKWCGFEASWGAFVPYIVDHPGVKHPRYMIQKQDKWIYVEKLPPGNIRYRIENWLPFCVIADDVAYKHGVFCSPDQYKRFFAPIYKKVAGIIHEGGGKVFFHSDGFTEPYWPTWIDYCGFDGQESLEPQAWDLPDGEDPQAGANLKKPGRVIRYLKEKYGDKFVLIGNMDMSTVMPLATPEEVASVTKDVIESGAPGGGFVFACCTDITEATPLENIIAMREAYRKYRHCYGN